MACVDDTWLGRIFIKLIILPKIIYALRALPILITNKVFTVPLPGEQIYLAKPQAKALPPHDDQKAAIRRSLAPQLTIVSCACNPKPSQISVAS